MKTGDRVRLTSTRFSCCDKNPIWPHYDVVGTIAWIRGREMGITVKWDNGRENIYDVFDLTVEKNIFNVDKLFEEIEL